MLPCARKLALLPLLAALACSSGEPEEIDEGFPRADFFSTSAKEFVLRGRSFVTVEDGAGEQRAKNLIKLKQVSLAWFINSTLAEDQDEKTLEVFGFGAMVKTGRDIVKDIKKINDNSFEFQFEQIIAGKLNLLKLLEVELGEEFSIEIGKPTNKQLTQLEINNEWYREEPFSPWDPDKVPADQKEELFLTLAKEEPTADAWWDYRRLIKNNKIRIDAHFGWDFHDNFHLKHSEDLFNWLTKQKGFDAPVKSAAKYNRTSGPLTRTIDADGREVLIEVRIFRGVPKTSVDPDTASGAKLLEKDLRNSLKVADVIVFSGHSGPFFGFPMANWKEQPDEGDFDDSEMSTCDMPADKYQVIFAEGCDTFMIGPAFLDNIHKKGKNVDIITTTSMSDAEGLPIRNFLNRLLDLDSKGRHRPLTVRALLAELDPAAMYGVHGVEDNPHLHPYAEPENFCASCKSHGECGGAGNLCLQIPGEGKRCTAPCTTDEACGEGFVCKKPIKADTSLFSKVCVPKHKTCE